MALTKFQQRTLAGLQRALQKIKHQGTSSGSKILRLAYTRAGSRYHHIYKEGNNLVSQERVIGKVKKGMKFVNVQRDRKYQAMDKKLGIKPTLVLIKSQTKDPYFKYLKGGKIRKSALPKLAKKIASLKLKKFYKTYTSKPGVRALINKRQNAWRAKRKK